MFLDKQLSVLMLKGLALTFDSHCCVLISDGDLNTILSLKSPHYVINSDVISNCMDGFV